MKHLLRILLLIVPLMIAVPPANAQDGISKRKQEKIQKDKEKKEGEGFWSKLF